MSSVTAPIFAINYKVYPTAFADRGLAIALAADKIAGEYGDAISVILAVPATELVRISEVVENVKVYAQHADPVEPGAHTGYIPLEAIKAAGAKGTLLNHSEHRLKVSDIDWLVQKAMTLGIETLVCADTPSVAAAIAVISPTYIAIEPPELIGTGIPVSKARPEIIINTIKTVHRVNPDIPVLAGAGISQGEDVEVAIKLGAAGVLVASAIMKAKNPEEKIREMVEAAYRAWKK